MAGPYSADLFLHLFETTEFKEGLAVGFLRVQPQKQGSQEAKSFCGGIVGHSEVEVPSGNLN